MVWRLWNEATYRARRGVSIQRALRTLRGVVRYLATAIGDTAGKARALNTIGWIYRRTAGPRGAIDWNERSIEAAARHQGAFRSEIESKRPAEPGGQSDCSGPARRGRGALPVVEQVVRDPKPPERLDALALLSAPVPQLRGVVAGARRPEKAHGIRGRVRAAGRIKRKPEDHRESAAAARPGVDGAGQARTRPSQRSRSRSVSREEVGNPPQLWKTSSRSATCARRKGTRTKHAMLTARPPRSSRTWPRRLSDESLREHSSRRRTFSSIRELPASRMQQPEK